MATSGVYLRVSTPCSARVSKHTVVVKRSWLKGCPVRKRIAQLREAMNESHMGHLSRLRLILSRFAAFNDREVNVIIDVNVLYFDPQARWISADVTNGKLKIMHHHLPPFCWECNDQRILASDESPAERAGTPQFYGAQRTQSAW